MNRSKKWMVTLSDEQYDWIRSTAKAVEVNGSAIIQALIDKTRQSKDKAFRDSLLVVQQKMRRATLEQKKSEIEEELNRLDRAKDAGDDIE